MFETVFVLGAGASHDLDAAFPIGGELAHRIEQTMDVELMTDPYNAAKDSIIWALSANGGFGDPEAKAMRRILDGISASDSIDKFVDEWQGFARLQEIAKIAISLHILRAERVSSLSKLKFGSTTNASQLRSVGNQWIGKIANNVGPGLRKRDFEERFANIAFVTFNYDRTLEWYLAHYISTSFAVRMEEAIAFVREMPIFHVYGSLGNPFGGDHLEFGAKDQSAIYAAKNILTFCEEVNSDHARKMSEVLLNCKTTVFLGCAFHKQNLALLYPRGSPRKHAIWATSYKMRPREKDAVYAFFDGCQVSLQDQLCSSFMNDHWDDIL